MLTLVGPRALTSSKINELINKINATVNSSVVTAIETVFVHYVSVPNNSPILQPDSSQRATLEDLLNYDTHLDPATPISNLLIQSVNTDILLSENIRLLRVIPKKGTVSTWSFKATSLLKACGLEVNRVERGVIYLLQIRKGFPIDQHIDSDIFLEFFCNKLQEVCFIFISIYLNTVWTNETLRLLLIMFLRLEMYSPSDLLLILN